MRVVIYGRPGCHLCEEAEQAVAGLVAARPGASVVVVDIESDDRLLRDYLERIPVVELDGEILSELVFDPGPLEHRLSGA